MSSAVTREGVEAAAWKAGVRDRKKMGELMRVIDTYAYGLNRTELPDVILPEVHDNSASPRGSLYLCKSCETRLPVGMFPDAKRDDPLHPYDCIPCGGADRKTYACPECTQQKTLDEFPEAKRLRPRTRCLCLWCEKRVVQVKDVDRYRYRR